MAPEDLMAKLTQKGGGKDMYDIDGNFGSDPDVLDENTPERYIYPNQKAAADAKAAEEAAAAKGGRRKRHSKSHKGNSWLDHVKYTMKEKKNKGKSFKQILKLAKKSYKKSQSQSGGKGRKGKTRKGQNGGSGGKVAGVGESASPYV